MDAEYAAAGSSYELPKCTLTAPKGMVFDHWLVDLESGVERQPGKSFAVPDEWWYGADITVTAVWVEVPYGTPDFTLPEGLTTIEESAFEGITSMTVVDASNCSSIGNNTSCK